MTFRKEVLAEGIELYNADCREVLPTLGVFDALIMDPPYSSGGFQEAGKSSGSIGTRSKETIALDNLSSRGYQRLMREVLGHLRKCDEAYVFTDWKMWVYTCDALEDAGFRVRNMLVWDKEQMGMGMPWRNQHELIAFGKRTSAKIMSGKYGNVIKTARTGNENHPTEKPADLIWALIDNSPVNSFIDPFMGSGTTGVAAARHRRKFTGIEMESRYFDIACKRISEALKQPDFFVEKPKPAKQEALL